MPVWILDSGSGNHLACEKRLPDELRESIRRNATMVRMATANGPATATDVVDVDVPGLEAHARVLLLKGCPAVLSLGRLVEDHKCSFLWNSDGAVLIDSSGNRHECVVRNYVPFLGDEYALPVRDESAEDLLDEILPEGHDELDEDRPGMIHDLTHLRKRPTARLARRRSRCLLRRRRNPALRERPVGWAHTLLADHLSSSDMKIEKQDFKMCLVLLCAGTSSATSSRCGRSRHFTR